MKALIDNSIDPLYLPACTFLLPVQVPKGEPGGGSALLELWSGDRLLKEFKIPPSVHGALYADGVFGA